MTSDSLEQAEGATDEEVAELMLRYSRRGLEDWRTSADELLKRRAWERLSAAGIAEDEAEAEAIIEDSSRGTMFIPMPNSHGGRGFQRSFFRPGMRSGRLRALMLFILVERSRGDCIAFRFECAERPGTRHEYTHVQLTRDLHVAGRPIGLDGIPDWLPDSYPAFPIPARDSLELFLAMATAVHGFPQGIDALIAELYQGGRIDRGEQHRERLRSMLSVLD